MLGVDGVLYGSGEAKIGVDILHADFVKCKVSFAFFEDVGGKEGLAFYTLREAERCGEGCGRGVDSGPSRRFCGRVRCR